MRVCLTRPAVPSRLDATSSGALILRIGEEEAMALEDLKAKGKELLEKAEEKTKRAAAATEEKAKEAMAAVHEKAKEIKAGIEKK